MDTVTQIALVLGQLIPEIVSWITDLIDGGNADPAGTIRSHIRDHRQEIASRRAERDAQLDAKHGRKPGE